MPCIEKPARLLWERGQVRRHRLALACQTCNQNMGNRLTEMFLEGKTEVLVQIMVKAPLLDAAVSMPPEMSCSPSLIATSHPMMGWTWRADQVQPSPPGPPKTQVLDFACVGVVEAVEGWQRRTLPIKATDRGKYQRMWLTAHCFPWGYLARRKRHLGFQSGDLVHADVPAGKTDGVHHDHVAMRQTSSFNIQKSGDMVQGMGHRHCHLVQRADSYICSLQPFDSAQLKKETARAGAR